MADVGNLDTYLGVILVYFRNRNLLRMITDPMTIWLELSDWLPIFLNFVRISKISQFV
jgi:hypothetical protein